MAWVTEIGRAARPAPVAHPFDDAVRLALAEIRADADMLRADQLGEARHHLGEALERAVGAALQMQRIERQTEHAAACRERPQHRVRLVARHRMPG